MKGKIFFFFFALLLNLNISHAFVCDIGPNVGNLQDLLKVVEEDPGYDQLFCKGIDLCQSGNYNEPVPEAASNCNSAQNDGLAGKTRIESRNFGSCGLTNEEIAAVEFYTGSGYNCLNSVLRKKTDNKAINKVVASLNSGLSKIPSYKGIVMRGASLPEFIREQHKEGNVVTYEAFTSSSTSSGFSGTDRFIIFSKTGKPIMGFSSYSNESEVLFRSGTQFKVLKRYVESGTNYYVMKEVTNQKNLAVEEEEDKKTLDLYLANKGKYPTGGSDNWYCPKENPLTFEKEIEQKSVPSF